MKNKDDQATHMNKFSCNHFEKEERAGCFFLLSYRCLVNVIVGCLYFRVPWVGLQCVIMAFPGHTHLLLQLPH